MNWNTSEKMGILGIILFFIIGIIIIPLVIFWIGYFLGWVSTFICGDFLVKGINSFGFNITVNDIPCIAGALCWAGYLFHPGGKIQKEG